MIDTDAQTPQGQDRDHENSAAEPGFSTQVYVCCDDCGTALNVAEGVCTACGGVYVA